MGPSSFRYSYLAPYAEAFEGWLENDAHVIDTSGLTPPETAAKIAVAVGESTAQPPSA